MEDEKPELPIVPNKEPEQSEDMIDKANRAAVRLEEANKKQEALLDRQERMQIEKSFGGKSDAGNTQKLDETPEEYKNRVLAGDV